METAQGLFRLARNFFLGTLFSRGSGMLREIVMAFCFGASPEVAGFLVSYRLAYLFRRLLGEGNAQAGFVPRFEALRQRGMRDALLFYRDAVWSSGFLLLLAAALWIAFLQGAGWAAPSWQPICSLGGLMVPSLVFLGLFSLQAGLLQCQKKTFWPAFSPVFFNLSWIAAVLFAARKSHPMELLALGVTGACAVQWLFSGWQTYREWRGILSWKDWLRPRLFSADWRQVLKPMGLGVLGVAATQVNSALDLVFARFSDLSGPAYLSYAIRVYQLPLALFGISLSGTLLAPLTRAFAYESKEKGRALLSSSVRMGNRLMLLSTGALLALGPSGLNLLYGRGLFTVGALEETILCLFAYALGLFPTVQALILTQGYYAEGKYKIPTWATLVSVLFNIGLNSLLVFGLGLGSVSVALATSLSAWGQCAVLRSFSPLEKSGEGGSFPLARTALAAAVCLAVQLFVFPWLPREIGAQLGQCLGAAFLFGIVLGRRVFARKFFERLVGSL